MEPLHSTKFRLTEFKAFSSVHFKLSFNFIENSMICTKLICYVCWSASSLFPDEYSVINLDSRANNRLWICYLDQVSGLDPNTHAVIYLQ